MDLIIKKGTELFHATGEPFEEKDLKGGGYDGLIWTTTDSSIAQTYIPVAPSEWFVSTESFLRPNENKELIALQKNMGIEFDDITWKGGRAQSYTVIQNPFTALEKEEDKPDSNYLDIQRKKFDYVNNFLSNTLGYKPSTPDKYGDHGWKLKVSNGEVMPADFRFKGRLFILVPNVDLKIYDMTDGETIEGDLTDVQYHSHKVFAMAKERGFDGVKINDFAQSNDQGNFGHTSIGIFPKSLSKMHKEVVQDVIHHDLDSHYQSRDWKSPEYKKHRNIAEVRKVVQKLFKENLFL